MGLGCQLHQIITVTHVYMIEYGLGLSLGSVFVRFVGSYYVRILGGFIPLYFILIQIKKISGGYMLRLAHSTDKHRRGTNPCSEMNQLYPSQLILMRIQLKIVQNACVSCRLPFIRLIELCTSFLILVQLYIR